MQGRRATELIMIRHAPALADAKLCGRTDVPADCTDGARIAAVRGAIGSPGRILTSPAVRCRQTAAELWPEATPPSDARLWEQSFGAWEGRRYADLPDLGPLSTRELAHHRAPGGESFADVCGRVWPILAELETENPIVIVAHAGTVRAALALALGSVEAGLAFDVEPLSITRLRAFPDGKWAILSVNWTPT